LKIAFGQSIELDSDEVGLLLGPIAAVCPFPKEVNNARNNRSKAKDLFENSCKRIRDIATYHQTAFFLTPESNVQRLNGIIGEENPMVLSIVDSKGLEFFEVVIVDFFSSIPPADRSAWKKLFTLKPGDQLGDFPYPQIESQLKNLYVAITRARNRLIFIETGLYDVYKNGTGFEVVESVWKAWSIQVNKENSSNSEEAKETLIEKFDADLEANKDLVGKNPRELAAGALTFIEKVYVYYYSILIMLIVILSQ
jgi:superfamily I DNA/RNA helicase